MVGVLIGLTTHLHYALKFQTKGGKRPYKVLNYIVNNTFSTKLIHFTLPRLKKGKEKTVFKCTKTFSRDL